MLENVIKNRVGESFIFLYFREVSMMLSTTSPTSPPKPQPTLMSPLASVVRDDERVQQVRPSLQPHLESFIAKNHQPVTTPLPPASPPRCIACDEGLSVHGTTYQTKSRFPVPYVVNVLANVQ